MIVKALKSCALIAALLTLAAAQVPQGTSSPARVISGPNIQYADDQFAVITWSTDSSSESRVFYGLGSANLNQVAESPGARTTHRVHLSNLRANTTYYFEIDTGQAEPGAGAVHSFQTVGAGAPPLRDQRPVQVTSAQASRLTRGPLLQYLDDHSAVISWSTSAPSGSRVYYGTDRNNLTLTAESGGEATSHRVHLTDLRPDTAYYFQIDTGEGSAPPVNSFRTVVAGAPPHYEQQPGSAGGLARRPAETATTSARGAREIPEGVQVHAALDTALSSKTSQLGDRFSATVTEPVRANDGSVAIPTGSRINGEVTEAESGKTLPALRGRGRLNMRFREIVLPNGAVVPLTASLTSVNETATGEEGEVESRTKGSTAAKGVGIGAGIGTVAGLIFGGALKGLVIGAIAGGGYVLASKGKDVELPAQTGIVLRLDRTIMVPAYTGGR